MIEAKGITKTYGKGESRNKVLKGIDLRISDGDYVVILGASGSGKSTLLNCLSGLERVDEGIIEYDGVDITTLSDKKLTEFRKDNVGFIFQQYYLLPNMTVDKNVKMGADLSENDAYKEIIKGLCSIGRTKTKSGRVETDKSKLNRKRVIELPEKVAAKCFKTV